MTANEQRDLARFKERFEPGMHHVIDSLAERILAMDPGASLYLTESGFWMGFQRGEKAVARRGHPFVQLVTEHKRKVGNLAMRVFLTTPLPGSAYADPERLLESSGTYRGQAHVTVRLGSNLGQVMALVEQSYRFKVIKSE